MSGFDRQAGCFDLTATKVAYWHRSRGARRECSDCSTAAGIVAAHLDGFEVEPHGNWWRVRGPGIGEGWTADLYEAISGNPGDREPGRRWSF